MLDTLAKIATATVLDVDGGGAVARTENSASFTLGRSGLVEGLNFVVHITDGTVAVIEPAVFNLQVSVDNGSVWQTVASITASVADNPVLLSAPAGLNDLRHEAYTPANVLLRVSVSYTGVAATQTDNVTYDAYLAGRQTQRNFI